MLAADGDVVGDGVSRRAGCALLDHLCAVGSSGVGGARPLGGDQAVVDRDELVGAVGPHGRPPVGQDGVALARAPPQAVVAAPVDGHGLDVQPGDEVRPRVEPPEPHQLLAHHGRLEVTLRGERDVLEVAAPAQPRPGVGARWLDPVGGGYVDADGVAAPEPVAVGALGDLDDDPLARQGVAHEHDAGLRLGEPGDAVPAVGDGTHLDLEALPHPRAPAGATGTVVAARWGAHTSSICRLVREWTRPRRRSPACTRTSSRRRSSATWEDRSW